MSGGHIEIEDAVTARMKLRHPEIGRIGVQANHQGWRCYQVWTVRGAAPPSYDQTDKFLAVADAILMRITGELDDPKGKPLNRSRSSGGFTVESRWRE
jgi:hypothetical protein